MAIKVPTNFTFVIYRPISVDRQTMLTAAIFLALQRDFKRPTPEKKPNG